MTLVHSYSVHQITLNICEPINSCVGKDESKNLIYESSQ